MYCMICMYVHMYVRADLHRFFCAVAYMCTCIHTCACMNVFVRPFDQCWHMMFIRMFMYICLYCRFDEIKSHIKIIRNSRKIRDVSRALEGE